MSTKLPDVRQTEPTHPAYGERRCRRRALGELRSLHAWAERAIALLDDPDPAAADWVPVVPVVDVQRGRGLISRGAEEWAAVVAALDLWDRAAVALRDHLTREAWRELAGQPSGAAGQPSGAAAAQPSDAAPSSTLVWLWQNSRWHVCGEDSFEALCGVGLPGSPLRELDPPTVGRCPRCVAALAAREGA